MICKSLELNSILRHKGKSKSAKLRDLKMKMLKWSQMIQYDHYYSTADLDLYCRGSFYGEVSLSRETNFYQNWEFGQVSEWNQLDGRMDFS